MPSSSAKAFEKFYRKNMLLFENFKKLKASLKNPDTVKTEMYINDFFKKLIVVKKAFILYPTGSDCEVFIRVCGDKVLEPSIRITIPRKLFHRAIYEGLSFGTRLLGYRLRAVIKEELHVYPVRNILCVPIGYTQGRSRATMIVCLLNKKRTRAIYKINRSRFLQNSPIFQWTKIRIIKKIDNGDILSSVVLHKDHDLIDSYLITFANKILFCNWSVEYITELLCSQLCNMMNFEHCFLTLADDTKNRLVRRITPSSLKRLNLIQLESVFFVKGRNFISPSFYKSIAHFSRSNAKSKHTMVDCSKPTFTVGLNDANAMIVGELMIKIPAKKLTPYEFEMISVIASVIESHL